MIRKKYPYGIDFQTALAALYCQDPGFRRTYNDVVKYDYFDDDVLIHIIRLAKKIYREGKPVTKTAIEAEFVDEKDASASLLPNNKRFIQDFEDSLVEVYEMSLEHLDYIPDKVVKFAQRQAVADACHKIAKVLDSGDNIEVVKSIMDRALLVGSSRDLGYQFYEAAAELGMLKAGMMHDTANKIPTGLPLLDENMRGGLSLGELGMVIGPTGRGKSIVLVNLAANALRAGKNVVYITFELFEHEVLLRFFQNLTGCTDDEVLEEDPEFRGVLNTFLKDGKKNLQIKYFPPSSLSTIQLRAYLCRLQAKEEWSPDLLILDDADSMRVSRPGRNDSVSSATYQALGSLYSDIIALLVDFNCASWVASQATRSAFDSEVVDLSHTSDSFKKAHKANMALAICQTPEEQAREEARLFVAKARAYKSGYFVPIKFHKTIMSIEERQRISAKLLSDRGTGITDSIKNRRKKKD